MKSKTGLFIPFNTVFDSAQTDSILVSLENAVALFLTSVVPRGVRSV